MKRQGNYAKRVGAGLPGISGPVRMRQPDQKG